MQVSLIPADELGKLLRSIVKSEMDDLLTKIQTPTINGDQILTRKNVAQIFDVSLVTVNDWTSKGLLTSYKLNGRTYYKKDEVLQALRQVKHKRR